MTELDDLADLEEELDDVELSLTDLVDEFIPKAEDYVVQHIAELVVEIGFRLACEDCFEIEFEDRVKALKDLANLWYHIDHKCYTTRVLIACAKTLNAYNHDRFYFGRELVKLMELLSGWEQYWFERLIDYMEEHDVY